MQVYELNRRQWLPHPPEAIFPFFADAGNLEAITPSFLRFRVVTPQPISMGAGTLIDYKLRVRGIPIRWRTLISAWEPPFRFVDEMVRGPYQLWHHEHVFEPRDGGTLCIDRVRYSVRGGPLIAPLIHSLFVRRDVELIFDHRQQALEALFNKKPTDAPARSLECAQK